MVNYFLLISYCTAYAVLNVIGAGLIKKELALVKLIGPTDYAFFLFRPYVILGFVVIFIGTLTMFKALSIFKFSLVSPVATGMNVGLTIFIGFYFFEEKLNWLQFAGLILIIAGITAIALGKTE